MEALTEGGAAPRKPPRGGLQWREEARVAAAELLGTALLVLLGCAGAGRGAGRGAGPAAAGLTVAALVQCLDHVSGAMFNPTVTLAALLWGRVSARRAAAMVAAQLAGAALGAGAGAGGGAGCVCGVAAGCGPAGALALEAAGGAVLALANCASWDARNAHLRDSWPLRIGATVAALSAAADWCSGASFNPARSLGPALLAGDFTHQWVYWAGPLGGSLAATALYCALWRPPPPPAPSPAPAPAPPDPASRRHRTTHQ